MGRFLGKISMECRYKEFGDNIFDIQFDELEGECTWYSYSFYKAGKMILFCFDIGTERYSLFINDKHSDGSIFTKELLRNYCL